jgi:branched-chain amino acid transport system ATP-binding protein
MLEVENISASYGAVRALEQTSLRIEQQEIVCLLGSNGAGKTTMLNCISGVLPLAAGRIRFEGQDLASSSVDKIVAMGIVQVPEGREIFPHLSTADNLMLGAWTQRNRSNWRAQMEYVYDLFPRLRERTTQMAGTLSGGEQQMLLIGRALMAKPKLLMFDEPSLGLSPLLVQLVFDIIRKIHVQGMTVLLVEQNARMALHSSQRGYILENGEMKLSGLSRDLSQNPQVQAAYLGA